MINFSAVKEYLFPRCGSRRPDEFGQNQLSVDQSYITILALAAPELLDPVHGSLWTHNGRKRSKRSMKKRLRVNPISFVSTTTASTQLIKTYQRLTTFYFNTLHNCLKAILLSISR